MNTYESVTVFEKETNEVIAMIPLKIGRDPILKDGFDAKILLDTERCLTKDDDGRVIYKGGK